MHPPYRVERHSLLVIEKESASSLQGGVTFSPLYNEESATLPYSEEAYSFSTKTGGSVTLPYIERRQTPSL